MMRNKWRMALAVVLVSTQVMAQDLEYRERLTGGFKLGGNLSNVYDSEGEEFDADAKLGLAAGAFLSIPIGKYFGLQPEVMLSQKGFQATGRILGSTYSFKRTTTFLDIPLLFAIKPSEFFTIVVGPQYSFLLRQKDVFANASSTIEQEQEFENDNIRKNILCGVIGFDITVDHFLVGLRAGADFQNNNGNKTEVHLVSQ